MDSQPLPQAENPRQAQSGRSWKTLVLLLLMPHLYFTFWVMKNNSTRFSNWVLGIGCLLMFVGLEIPGMTWYRLMIGSYLFLPPLAFLGMNALAPTQPGNTP